VRLTARRKRFLGIHPGFKKPRGALRMHAAPASYGSQTGLPGSIPRTGNVWPDNTATSKRLHFPQVSASRRRASGVVDEIRGISNVSVKPSSNSAPCMAYKASLVVRLPNFFLASIVNSRDQIDARCQSIVVQGGASCRSSRSLRSLSKECRAPR
jgi:hypothetical protein